MLFPGARILSLVFLGFFYQLLEVPALIVLGFWFVLQLIDGFASLGAETRRAAWRSSPTSAASCRGARGRSLLRAVGAGAAPRPVAPLGPWDNRRHGARLVEMVVESVRVHMLSNRHVVILKETDGDRYLPIWIGPGRRARSRCGSRASPPSAR